ncbi:hypothetical protein MLD38_005600 [Melastoma candidum]|uniref:Uncharacterized protein n=1 Tax=Melastoma candidum TaxID=119954 RepID=A0ACB9RTL0_9MYRT|nr:hypothetical protein MLD38_005600 [Melastoma candidum]
MSQPAFNDVIFLSFFFSFFAFLATSDSKSTRVYHREWGPFNQSYYSIFQVFPSATINPGSMQVTQDTASNNGALSNISGRVVLKQPFDLWDTSGWVASFNSSFVINISEGVRRGMGRCAAGEGDPSWDSGFAGVPQRLDWVRRSHERREVPDPRLGASRSGGLEVPEEGTLVADFGAAGARAGEPSQGRRGRREVSSPSLNLWREAARRLADIPRESRLLLSVPETSEDGGMRLRKASAEELGWLSHRRRAADVDSSGLRLESGAGVLPGGDAEAADEPRILVAVPGDPSPRRCPCPCWSIILKQLHPEGWKTTASVDVAADAILKYLFEEPSPVDEHSRGYFAETLAVVAGGLVNCSAGSAVLIDAVGVAFADHFAAVMKSAENPAQNAHVTLTDPMTDDVALAGLAAAF